MPVEINVGIYKSRIAIFFYGVNSPQRAEGYPIIKLFYRSSCTTQ